MYMYYTLLLLTCTEILLSNCMHNHTVLYLDVKHLIMNIKICLYLKLYKYKECMSSLHALTPMHE